MAQVAVAQTTFDRVVRDVARNRLPQGSAWNLQDYIPNEIDAPLAKRGGWAYASADLSATLSGADLVLSVFYAPFAAGSQLVAIVKDQGAPAWRCVQCVSSSSTTDRGSIGLTSDDYFPTFYRDKVYWSTGSGFMFYDGSSNINNIAAAPAANWVTPFKDRLVLARTSSEPQRIYFSDAGDPTSWDTTNRYIDASSEVAGIWALRNMLIIWEKNRMERIIGSIPPPGTDMYLQPMYDAGLGLRDCFSIAGTDQFVCFANNTGAYMTDGSAVVDLTKAGGIKNLWQTHCAQAVNSLRFSGGFFRGWYLVTIFDASANSTFIACWACNLATRGWIRLTNITSNQFARKIDAFKEDLFFADFGQPRVGSLASIFNPSSTVKNDGDGTAVTPVLETPFYEVGFSKGRVRRAYMQYDVRDSASDNPTLDLSYVTSPENTSYTSVSSVSETTELTQSRFNINKAAFGVGLKISQTNASATTRINKIGIEGHPRESSRV